MNLSSHSGEAMLLDLITKSDCATLQKVEKIVSEGDVDGAVKVLKKSQNRENRVASADPNADTVQFTVIDEILFAIQELKRQSPDLAEALDGFYGLVAKKCEDRNGETVQEKEARHGAVARAAEEILESVTALMGGNRVFKANEQLKKAHDKFDKRVEKLSRRPSYDPQKQERERQKQ